jgi:hypothetical protein
MIARNSGGVEIPKLEGGVYTAVSSAMIDIGLQTNEKFDKTQRKFMMVWTILNEQIEINGEMQDRVISKEYTFSLHEKSTLRKDLQAWRGKAFTDEELNGFDLLNVLNKACQLQIIQEERNGKSYNNIAGIMSLPKGTEIKGVENAYYFDIETESTWIHYKNIPNWIREKIKKANNYESSGLKDYVEMVEDMEKNGNSDVTVNPVAVNSSVPNDDLPF